MPCSPKSLNDDDDYDDDNDDDHDERDDDHDDHSDDDAGDKDDDYSEDLKRARRVTDDGFYNSYVCNCSNNSSSTWYVLLHQTAEAVWR